MVLVMDIAKILSTLLIAQNTRQQLSANAKPTPCRSTVMNVQLVISDTGIYSSTSPEDRIPVLSETEPRDIKRYLDKLHSVSLTALLYGDTFWQNLFEEISRLHPVKTWQLEPMVRLSWNRFGKLLEKSFRLKYRTAPNLISIL